MNFTENIKRFILPAVLVAAVLVSLFKPSSDNLGSYSRQIQDKLNGAESFFQQAVQSKVLWTALAGNKMQAPVLDNAARQNIFLFYYKGDSLAHWTSNSVQLLSSPSILQEGTSVIRLKNGWYQAMKYTNSAKREIVLGLVAIKYQYPFENKFLKNDFALGLQIPGNIEISEERIKGSAEVKDLGGKTMFGLYESEEEKGDYVSMGLLLSQIILLLVVFYYIHYFAANIAVKRGFLPGFIYLLLSVLAIRTVMLWFDQPSELYRLDLFHPANYASSVATKSLGDLLLNSVILIWVVLFWAVYRQPGKNEPAASPMLAAFFIAIVFAFTGLVTWLFKTLVMDSVISFEVYNVLSLGFYSALGLVCIALVLMAHFLVVRDVVRYLHRSKLRPPYITAMCLVAGILFSLLALHSPFYQSILFSALWTVVYILVLYRMEQKANWVPVRNLLIFISFYSLLSTYLIENLYERKERNQRKFFAGKLVSERDFIAEYMFDDVAQHISADVFIKNFLGNPLVPQREIDDRLSSIYLSGYFNKYELKTYAYDKNGNAIRNTDTLPLSHFNQQLHLDTIASSRLLYVADTSQNYSYYSFFPFQTDSSFTGTLVLRLIPKVYYGQNVYPELLLGENISSLAEYSYYHYAVYQRDKLIVQHGDFPYSYYWDKDFDFGKRQYAYIDIGDWEHVIYRFANDKKVVVTIGQEGLFEPVATFSYLFSFFFLVVVIARLADSLRRNRLGQESILSWFTISFRTRINYSMLLMIVTSFVIIGFITISFFRKQYDNFYNDRLLRKEKVVHASLEYFIQQNGGDIRSLKDERLNGSLSFEVARMAEINEIDINLYNADGDLAVASQPGIYDKGILSKKMNPDAFFELATIKGTQVTEQEKVGGLKYMATYAPVRNNAGQAIAYLGIPYFAKSKNINDEVSSFLVALMNVYVFLLICAAILAFFISNSITRPLTIISEKLRILNLNKKNEPIEWKSKDEIGVLIGEYNKMIEELEHSARKLARSERESAWREMAKQIAHEIKNPLTPMKLSIQYLQRAIAAGDPNIEVLAQKVARTLEEQIENLSSIATAFSSFAKMPKAQNEIINLNELLRSITDLFNREETTTVTFNSECESPRVFADKNQLVSVFNNLLKNALQSIPENRQGFVDVHIKEENGFIQTTVSDNGGGIPSKLYDKVFVPNFTTKSSGTGLGLAISRQIVEGAGGRIWFESAENVGTTFFVTLHKSDSV